MQNINTKSYETEIMELKSKIDNFRPFCETRLKNLKSWFNISFTAQSNAIEWNSFTDVEVKVLIEDWITIWWKTIKEVKETQNLAWMISIIWEFFGKEFLITNDFILGLHRQLLTGIEKEYLWKYRDIQVYISWSSDIPPSSRKLEELMKNFIDFCNEENKNMTWKKCPCGIEKIAKIHYDFVKIHPFTDWNWRIARLIMNLYFVKYWFLPIIFPVVTRLEYIKSLWKDKNFEDFYKYFLWQTKENMSDYLRFFEW